MLDNESKNGKFQEHESATGQFRANEVDVAWLAGILDGEGCIQLAFRKDRFGKSVNCKVLISNCNFSLLKKAQTVIQTITHKKFDMRLNPCHRAGTVRNGKKRNYNFYEIHVIGQRAIRSLCEALLPYLTSKKEQASILVEFCRVRKEKRHVNSQYGDEEFQLISQMVEARIRQYDETFRGIETKPLAPIETIQ